MAREKEDEGLLVRFFKTVIPSTVVGDDGSAINTGIVEQDCISIIVPGSRDEHVATMNPDYRRRFGDEYAAWKTKDGAPITGIPLSEWPMANTSFVEEMRLAGVKSVEDLRALVDDSSLTPQVLNMKAKAEAWLEAASSENDRAKMAAENRKLREEIDQLKAKKK